MNSLFTPPAPVAGSAGGPPDWRDEDGNEPDGFTTTNKARRHFSALTVAQLRAEARQRGIAVQSTVTGRARLVEHLVYWTIGRTLDSRAVSGI